MPSHYEEDSLQPNAEISLVPDESVRDEESNVYIPEDLDYEGAKFAAAIDQDADDDGVFSVSEQGVEKSKELLLSGRREELVGYALNAETMDTMSVMESALRQVMPDTDPKFAETLTTSLAALNKQMQEGYPDATRFQKEKVVSKRAAERVASTFEPYNPKGGLAERLERVSSTDALKTDFARYLQKRNYSMDWVDAVVDGTGFLAAQLTPVVWAKYQQETLGVLGKLTGKDTKYSTTNLAQAAAEARELYASLDTEGRQAFLKTMYESSYGIFGNNEVAKMIAWDMILNYDLEDHALESGMTKMGLAIDLPIVLALPRTVAKVMKMAGRWNQLRQLAGANTAGAAIGDAIVEGATTKIGLNDAEAVGKAIAAGRHPYSLIDDVGVDGNSLAIRKRLEGHFNAAVAQEMARIDASGVTGVEKGKRIEALKNMYVNRYGERIHTIEWAEAEGGKPGKLKMRLYNEDGGKYHSEVDARTAARNAGWADDQYKLVTEEAIADIRKGEAADMIDAFHGGDKFDWFRKEFIGRGQGGKALGHGFYASLVRGMAERFARGRFAEGKEATLYDLKLPDEKFFLDFDKKFTKQSAEVKSALAQLLTPGEMKVLKNKDGRAIYETLANRLGGDETASLTLDSRGIVGNIGTSGIKEREVVVFSEKTMNDSIVRRTKMEGGARETAAEKAARLEEERALDEAGLDATGPLENAISYHKNMTHQNKAVTAAMEQGHPLFDKTTKLTSHKLIIGPSIDKKLGEWAERFTGFIKLPDNHRVVILHPKDTRAWEAKAIRETTDTKSAEQLAGWADEIKKRMDTSAAGVHTPIFHKDGSFTSVIVIDPEMSKGIKGVKLLAHEIGHGFQKTVFNKLPAAEKRRWLEQYNNVLQKTKGDIPAKELERIAFHMGALATEKRVESVAGMVEMAKLLGKESPQYKWLTSFNEYFAEQMAKYAMHHPEAAKVGGSVWKTFATQIRNYYRKVAVALNKLAQDGFDVSTVSKTADEWFVEMMEQHRHGDDLDFTKTLAAPEAPKKAAAPSGGGAEPPLPSASAPTAKSGGYLLEVEVDDTFATLHGYDPTDIDNMPWISLDPRHSVSSDAMMGRVIGVHQEARTRRDFANILEKPIKALRRSERQRVLAVLEEGDQASHAGGYGREFTSAELRARGFSDRELEAYMAVRTARYLSYFIHNKAMVDVARMKGLKEIQVFGLGKFIGKALPRDGVGAGVVFDLAKREFVQPDSAADWYDAGRRVVQFETPQEIAGQLVTRLLVSEEDATVRTIHNMIHYRPGEFARIYSDPYFIRVKRMMTVDGGMRELEMAVRTAATEKEAKAWIDAINKAIEMRKAGASTEELSPVLSKYMSVEEFVKEMDSGTLKDVTGIRWHFTREIDDFLGQTIESHSGTGKLFTRDRGEHVLTADRTREMRSNILNPYEALSAEVSMVSRFANVHEWKETQIRKWMTSFGDLLGNNRTGNDVADFVKAAGGSFSHTTGKRGLYAERTHRYIMRQIGIQTQEHRWWQSLMRRVGEGVTPYVGEGVGAVVRDANPLNFARSINHHFTLGTFNFSQIIVQANGMAIAAAIHPIHGLKAVSSFPILRTALMSDNPEVWARLSGLFGEDIGKVAKAIRRSGLIDNLRSTSLHNIEDGKMDIFRSMPIRTLSKMKDQGAFFFNRGEEFARVVSFDIARREWIKANPGKSWEAEGALQEILKRTDDFTQNMTRANLARWQEGVLSIPTQFLQFNIKLLQNITSALVKGQGSRGFSRADAAKALAGSILFYGAAGIGISNLVGEWLDEETQKKMSPTMRTAIGQGAVAAMFKAIGEALGAERFDLALGQRLGSINFFVDMIHDAYYDPKNVWEAMLGPTYSTGERLRVIGELATLWTRLPEVTVTDVGAGALAVIREQISSMRNATKAYIALEHGNRLQNRMGEGAVELSTPEILAQALGLAPSAAYDMYQVIGSQKQHKAALDDIANHVLLTQKKMLAAYQRGDEAEAKKLEQVIVLLFPTNVADYEYISRRVRSRLAPFDTQMQKLLHDHALKMTGDTLPFTTTNPLDKVK